MQGRTCRRPRACFCATAATRRARASCPFRSVRERPRRELSSWMTSEVPRVMRCSRLEADFWIHPSLDDIDEKIESHDQDRVKNHGAEDQRVVAIERAVHELAPDAG